VKPTELLNWVLCIDPSDGKSAPAPQPPRLSVQSPDSPAGAFSLPLHSRSKTAKRWTPLDVGVHRNPGSDGTKGSTRGFVLPVNLSPLGHIGLGPVPRHLGSDYAI
jgi:hypothetical protein